MILCIAEKPSVAGDIAKILGATARKDGYFEGNGYCVSWALGHLCCLKEPDDYLPEWKKWNLSSLPLVPAKYETKIINNAGCRKQFKTLKALLDRCQSVINCGDAGQEGELIQRWILQQARCTKPVKRLWISSLTDEAIRQGFKDLKPSSDYDNLYYAGMCRACGDWLLGMNATRLFTLKFGGFGRTLSVGRVQTPTLAMIVKRDEEIADFIPKDYFMVQTLYKGVKFALDAQRKQFATPQEAETITKAASQHEFTVDAIIGKRETEAPPLLFDLTALQVECNKLFGFSADTTLKLAQSLYEKKVTTYPRTDSRCLTHDMYSKCEHILSSIPVLKNLGVTFSSPLLKRKKVFDDSKVSDHHAIIPTGQLPSGLTEAEQKAYDLICLRFAEQFLKDAVYDKTEVAGFAGEYKFKATGKMLVDQGWKVLTSSEDKHKIEDKEDQPMPTMVKGEHGIHKPEIIKKTTQPPKAYTEGTLLKAMETCGKLVDDEELAEALKANGIGRPSTRAAIIETLLKREYIKKVGRNLVSTPAGKKLISLIADESLKSPVLTGLWEGQLRDIEKGRYSPAKFMSELRNMVIKLIAEAKNNSSGIVISSTKPKPIGGRHDFRKS